MSMKPRARPSDSAWQSVLDSANALAAAAAELGADREALLDRLRSALRGVGDRHGAFTFLGYLGSDYASDLIPELVEAALSHRDATKARHLIGRLPAEEARQVVPPAVWAQLERTSDYDAYRRMAELLDHLGLDDALEQLCATAAVSSDDDVREVAVDFRR